MVVQVSCSLAILAKDRCWLSYFRIVDTFKLCIVWLVILPRQTRLFIIGECMRFTWRFQRVLSDAPIGLCWGRLVVERCQSFLRYVWKVNSTMEKRFRFHYRIWRQTRGYPNCCRLAWIDWRSVTRFLCMWSQAQSFHAGSYEQYVRGVLYPACSPVERGGLGYRAVVMNYRGCAYRMLDTTGILLLN